MCGFAVVLGELPELKISGNRWVNKSLYDNIPAVFSSAFLREQVLLLDCKFAGCCYDEFLITISKVGGRKVSGYFNECAVLREENLVELSCAVCIVSDCG